MRILNNWDWLLERDATKVYNSNSGLIRRQQPSRLRLPTSFADFICQPACEPFWALKIGSLQDDPMLIAN